MSEVDDALKVLQLKRGATRLLGRSPPEPEEAHFRNRLDRVREHLHGCLAEPAAEPTNNRAERDLHPAVISRKLSCGNKTEAGKRTWEVLRSVTTTAVKQQLDAGVVAEMVRDDPLPGIVVRIERPGAMEFTVYMRSRASDTVSDPINPLRWCRTAVVDYSAEMTK